MKIAMVVRLDWCGLGTLSRIFRDFLGIDRTLSLCYQPNRSDDAWLNPATNRRAANNQITRDDAAWLLDGADAVLSFETWYGPEVPMLARERGAKTVLLPMFEQAQLGGIANGFTDLVISPHGLCQREMDVTPAFRKARRVTLPIPIDTGRIPFRRRERAKAFVHFAKEGDRDGTPAVMAAWPLVKSDARLLVYGDGESRDERIEFRPRRSTDYWTDYADGDVLLHVHRYAGYSCVMNDALAAGLPIMTTRFWPFCRADQLPRLIGPAEPELLDRYESDGTAMLPPSSEALSIEPSSMRRMVIGRQILAFNVTPEAIAAAVDSVYDTDVSEASMESRAWAEARSFEALRGAWLEEIAR